MQVAVGSELQTTEGVEIASEFKTVVSTPPWKLAAAVGIITCVGMFAVTCWGINRGLDPMVESFYLLEYHYPQLYPTFSSFHLILGKLPHLVSSEILHYRILEVIFRMAPPVVLALSVMRWSRARLPLSVAQRILVVTMSLIGGVLATAAFPRTISYNGFGAAVTLLAAAMAFFACAPNAVVLTRAGAALFLACGFFIGVGLFVKVSSAVIMFFAVSAVLLTQRRSLSIPIVLAGMALAAASYFVFVQAPVVWWHEFSEAVTQEAQSSHTVSMLWEPVLEIVQTHWRRGLMLLALGVGFNATIAWAPKKYRSLAFQVLVAGVALVLLKMTRSGYFVLHEANPTIVVLLAIGGALISGVSSLVRDNNGNGAASQPRPIAFLLGLGFLAALPFISTFGTNVNPLLNVCNNMGPWLLLVGLGSIACERRYRAPYSAPLLALLLVLYSDYHFFNQYVYNRYECDDLTQQRIELKEFPDLAGIKLDNRTAAFFRHSAFFLRSAGYKEGDPIISFYDLPGLVYAMRGVSPGQAWFVNWPHRDGINAYYLKKVDLSKAPRVFLVSSCAACIQKKVLTTLADEGLPPPSFKLIGKMPSPLPHQEELHFYVHKAGMSSAGMLGETNGDAARPFSVASGRELKNAWAAMQSSVESKNASSRDSSNAAADGGAQLPLYVNPADLKQK